MDGAQARKAAAQALAGEVAQGLVNGALAATLEAFVAAGFEVRFWSKHVPSSFLMTVGSYRQVELFDPTSRQSFWLQATLTVRTNALEVGAGRLEWSFISCREDPETGELLCHRLGFDFVKTSAAVRRPGTPEAFVEHLEKAWRIAQAGEHAQDWEAHGRRIAREFAGVLAP